MTFKEGDLVMTRDQVAGGYTRLWWKVMFLDNDGTFVGELERFDWSLNLELNLGYQKGEHVEIDIADVQEVYQEGMQFCYGDRVTVCECPALCRNK